MSSASQYAYLHSLVAVLAENLVTDSALDAMIDQPLAHYSPLLLNADLSMLAQHVSENEKVLFTPGQLETFLLHDFMQKSARIVRALSGIPRALIAYWIRRFEVGNIKVMLRGKMEARPNAMIKAELTDLGSASTLSFDELLRTEDVNELLRCLENTHYAAIAKFARSHFEKEHVLFTLETAVDRQYYIGLMSRVGHLESNEYLRLRLLIGQLIDQINLIWLLRYRLVYDLTPSHTYFLLTPGGYYLPGKSLSRLATIDHFEQLFHFLPVELKLLLAPCQTIHDIEIKMDSIILKTAQRILQTETFSLARALAYLVLRERQLYKIHAIIKGKLLNLKAGQIRQAVGF